MKKYVLSAIVAVFSLVILTSCEDVIDLKLKSTTQRTTIEGAVINLEGYSYVKVSYSGDFFNKQPVTRISNATVLITDDRGGSEKFVEGAEKGTYLPAPGFKGEVGRTYTLSVLIDGKEYKSSCKLLPVAQMDSLTSRFFKKDSVPGKKEGHYVYMYAKEPQDEKNFYRIKIYEEDSLYNDWGSFMYTDDKLVKERIEGLEFGFPFKEGKKVRVEMYSITEEIFHYYNQLFNLINNDGGLFSSPPQNPKNNISGGALGVFTASAIDIKEIRIKK